MDEYYEWAAGKRFELAKEVAFEILKDLLGRRGLRQEFEGSEPGIQNEILTSWTERVRSKIA